MSRAFSADAVNVYVGTTTGLCFYSQTVTAVVGATTPATVTALPSTALAQPAARNTTGIRANDGVTALRVALEDYMEARRLICAVFSVYNATYVPVPVTATVTIYDNYAQSDVQGRVQAALAILLGFTIQGFATAVPISAIYQAVMSTEGVRSVAIAAPTGDTAVADGQIAVLGTVTLTMVGGVTS